MKNELFVCLLVGAASLLFSCKKNEAVSAMNNATAAGIDTRGLDYYIKIAEILSGQKEPPQADWDSLFRTPYYDLLINQVKYSTVEDEKKELRLIYQQQTLTAAQQQQYAHQLDYRKNLPQLKVYSASLKDGSIRTLLKQYLYPSLPIRLQNDALIPSVVYTYYLAEEANGLPDIILQDALLAYKIDSYAKGILTAHEAFHSVATASLLKRYKLQLPDTDARLILTRSLIGISQEGIADLIDKETLGKADSPVYNLVQAYNTDDESKSKAFINALNAELVRLNTQETIADPTKFRQTVLAFAGHQPGRYMGKVIKQAGLLPEVITDVENPFQFFYTYTKAAARSPGTYPVFSTAAISYLKGVEQALIKPL